MQKEGRQFQNSSTNKSMLDLTRDATLCQNILWTKTKTLRGHLDSVRGVVWARGGLLTVGDDCIIRGWYDGKVSFALREHTSPITSLAKGDLSFATGDKKGLVKIFDTDKSIQGHKNFMLHSLRMSSAVSQINLRCEFASLLVAASSSLYFYKYDQKQQPYLRSTLQVQSISALTWKTEDVTVGCQDGSVHLLDSVRLKTKSKLSCSSAVQDFSKKDLLLAALKDGNILAFQEHSRQPIFNIYAHEAGVSSVTFHNCGNIFSTGGPEGSLRVWDIRKGKCLFETHIHKPKWKQGVNKLSHHPRLPVLASGGADGILNIFSQAK